MSSPVGAFPETRGITYVGMVCQACGTENRAGRKFCTRCGAGLARVCPRCEFPADPEDQFCGQCGAPLVSELAAAAARRQTVAEESPAEPVAERRLVSVLFADLVAFTTLSETRDPEEVRELLSDYFDTCRKLISRYGGVVEKFIGDAVMAVWGAPVAKEDDAERAVRAALDLTRGVAELGHDIGAPDLQARAAVVTGRAAVTLGAEGEGMVAGDLINTAARIQSAAPPGAVYVSEGTRRATEAAVAYEEAGSHELKGKSTPVRLWRALRVVGLRGGALRSGALEPPFVGRERELRLIKELFHASADQSRAHLVSVLGIAGIGKSRLAWELFKYIDGLADTVWWHRGRCLSYGEGVTYWALAEMVRGRAGIVENETPASAREKLRDAVAVHVTDENERRWIEPRLGHLLGLEERAAEDQENLFSAWRLFFERMSESHPTLLVFEDAQWADPALLDFIEYLLDWSRNRALFILTLARPDVTEWRPNWGAGRPSTTSLYLEPLSPGHMQELLSGLVPGLPLEVNDRIRERAQGVPLYAVETVRMLIDRGLLVQENDAFRLTEALETLEVPESLHALVAARLDGVSPEERRLIQDASILGNSFTVQALTYLSGTSPEEIQSCLSSLVRKEVLTLQADPRSPERGQYRFLQDLVRQVAYETLSKRERKAKCLAAASFIESTWGGDEDEIVEVVAAHYLEAYRAAPDAGDADEIRKTARDTLTRAGVRAASLAAPEQARRYFGLAADLTDDSASKAWLLERAGEMALRAGLLDKAKNQFSDAMELFESVSDTHAAARVSARLGEVEYEEGGRLSEAVERMESAFSVLHDEDWDADLATLSSGLGRLHFFTGEMDVAGRRLETALEIAEPLGLAEVTSQALNTKGLVLLQRGRVEESFALLRHALKVALENDLSAAALRAYVNLSELLFRRDRYHESLRSYEDGLALSRRVGNRLWESALLCEMTFPLFMIGRWDEALGAMSGLAPDDVARADILGALVSLPAIHAHRGRLEEAKRVLRVFGRYATSDDVQERAAYAIASATVHRAEHDAERALKDSLEAIEMGRRIAPDSHLLKVGLDLGIEMAAAVGDISRVEALLTIIDSLRAMEATPLGHAIGARGAARLANIRGDVDNVEVPFKRAAGMFLEIGVPFWRAVTLAEHAEWLARHNRADDAELLLREARETFRQLGATSWLGKLSTLSGAIASPGA